MTYGGITQVRGRHVSAEASTDAIVFKSDEFQEELGEGACLDAIWAQHTVIARRHAQRDRWPNFVVHAAELGVGSLISPLRPHRRPVRRGGSDDRRVLRQPRRRGPVRRTSALADEGGAVLRDLIGQAKGMLVRRGNITGQQSSDLLVRASQHSNVKLVEVARSLVDTHEHPDRAERTPQ